MIVQKQNTNLTVGYKDFRVRHQAIQQWITFLQANNSLYTGIDIDFDLLSKLSEDGSVKGQVNAAEEEKLRKETQNILTASRDTNTSPI
eukprot:879187-Ditylum_brightwellii.AAC.1